MNNKIKTLEADKKTLQQKLSRTSYCMKYITTGCFNENCPDMHVEKDQVDKAKAAKKAMAAAKDKAKTEAKRSQSVG